MPRRLALFLLLAAPACSCDESPEKVNHSVAALTPLPRLPADLADELRHLKAVIDEKEGEEAPHLTLARDTFVEAYVDGMLIAAATGRATTKLVALFDGDNHADLPGAKRLLDLIAKDHALHPFVAAVAMKPGVPRAEALKALAEEPESPSGQRARLLLALHFRNLLDAPQHNTGDIVTHYPYPCAATLNAMMRGDQPPAEERAACPVVCAEFEDPKEAKPRDRRKALSEACPPKALGLRGPEEMRYAGPQLAPLRFALVHGEANLRAARKDGGDLGDAVRRALSELQGSMKHRPFPGPFPGWFGPGEFPTGVIMDFGAPIAGGQPPEALRFVSINRTGGLRTGIRPGLAVDEQGTRFMDLESELAWPGRPVRTRPDPLFPAPSGDPLKDALSDLNMRAESLYEGAGEKPLMIVLSRKAPPRYVGRVLSELPRGTTIELAYWDHGVKAVRAQVGWTRVKEEVQTARNLELADTTEETPTERVSAEQAAAQMRAARAASAGDAGPELDAGATASTDASAKGAPQAGEEEEETAAPAGDAGPTLKLGAMGAVKLARSGPSTRVTISGKELLFNDLAGDARLPLRGYRSNTRSEAVGRWRARLVKMAGLLPKGASVMLYVRGDAPMDAVLELIGALAPRSVNLSFPHRRIRVVEDDLYAPPTGP